MDAEKSFAREAAPRSIRGEKPGDFAGRAAKQRRSRRRFRPIGGDETAAAGN